MAVKQAIAEHDVVALAVDVDAWKAGTAGTVVSDYGDVKLVEISDRRGQMLDLIQVRQSDLDLVSRQSDPPLG